MPHFRMIYYLIVVGVILLDRIVKHAVSSGMEPGQTIPLLENVFHITYVQNRGAAFSLMEGQWIFLIVLPMAALAIGIVLIFLKRKRWSALMLISVSLICGGGIGNLIDRIMQGYVVDLFDFRVFPVFNVADIAICVGCGLLLISVWFFEKKEGADDRRKAGEN
ncbi:MAG: signal peptidase II [Bacillota bacterium]|nr:signal peptidase II [Bacillota bacterium]